MVKLFVGGFPLDITEIELVKLISRYGTVSTIKIVRDKKTGTCKGYAFLEITDLEGAKHAIEALNGTKMGDRVLSLNITEEKPASTKSSFSRPKPSKPSAYVKVESPNSGIKKKRPRRTL